MRLHFLHAYNSIALAVDELLVKAVVVVVIVEGLDLVGFNLSWRSFSLLFVLLVLKVETSETSSSASTADELLL